LIAHSVVLYVVFWFIPTIAKQLLPLCLINAVVVCWL
jgi:hypothetical protein